MRLLAGILVGLACAPVAQASTPTDGQLLHASRVARAYWHGNPPCGAPRLEEPPVLTKGDEGQALPKSCTIRLSGTIDWRSQPMYLCVVMTHEWGHLVLGPNYFATTNPSDPSHDPNPESIMNAAGPAGAFPPCNERPGEYRQPHVSAARRSR